MVGKRRRRCLRVWLFPPFSFLLPSSGLPLRMFPLSAWLCSSLSPPGQAAAVLSHTGLLWAVAFQSARECLCPRGGGCGARPSGWGHIASSFLRCLNPHLLGEEATGPLPAASCSAWDHGTSRSGPRFPGVGWGEPTASAAPWHSVHLVVVLCYFAKDLYFWHEGIGEPPPQLGSGLECRIGIAFPLPLPPLLHIPS